MRLRRTNMYDSDWDEVDNTTGWCNPEDYNNSKSDYQKELEFKNQVKRQKEWDEYYS